MSPCRIANLYAGGAGVYRIVKIVGVTEETAQGGLGGFTYLTLEQVEEWFPGSPKSPVLRVSGGPVGPDVMESSHFHVELNEVAGFVLWEARPETSDHLSVAPTALFQKEGEGYDSLADFSKQHGTLSLDQIRDLLLAERGKGLDACPEPAPVETEPQPDAGGAATSAVDVEPDPQ